MLYQFICTFFFKSIPQQREYYYTKAVHQTVKKNILEIFMNGAQLFYSSYQRQILTIKIDDI